MNKEPTVLVPMSKSELISLTLLVTDHMLKMHRERAELRDRGEDLSEMQREEFDTFARLSQLLSKRIPH